MKITHLSLAVSLLATEGAARTPWTQGAGFSSSLDNNNNNNARHHRLAAVTLRGGSQNNNRGRAVNSYSNEDDVDAAANNIVQKVLMAMGAFALQQTLTKYVETRGTVATATKSTGKPVVSSANRSTAAITQKVNSKGGPTSEGATIPEHVL